MCTTIQRWKDNDEDRYNPIPAQDIKPVQAEIKNDHRAILNKLN